MCRKIRKDEFLCLLMVIDALCRLVQRFVKVCTLNRLLPSNLKYLRKMDHDAYYMVHYEDDNEFDTQNVVDEDITFMNEDSVDGDAILISLVQSHPYLYNKQLSDFKDSLKKENAWIEIAKILNMKGISL
ncbi:hypothetical protein ALC57_00014 [Trachymyrmex cornetzi]|uniref:MADF domain-containing protein n=1 Tax=Trachymyrmex cornetzi TaxID=471704 RepID=A0A151K2S3_9HYME|nr:hypothetical protein ALC57_00014 [Trachymyrmex cornetzi]